MLSLFLLSFHFTVAQLYPTPSLIQYLLTHKKPVNIINGVTRELVPPELLPEELRKETQYLIKSTAKLYAGINGTGRLYELSDSSGFLQASRIDSTVHSGSQFGALCFTKGDSIFSFGGYGYWKYNGTLRQFNFATRDWMALPLERETKGMFADFNWVDSANNTLYLEDLMLQSEALLPYPPKRITPPELISIHWASGKVQSLGKLTYNPHYGLQSPWGKLDFSAHEVTLYDFRHNRIYHAKKDLFLQMRKLKNPRHHAFHFMMDSTLYYGNTENNYFDSIRMSITQFEATGNPIYEKKTKMVIDGSYIWVLLIPFVTLIGAAWIRRRGAVWQNTRSETSSTIAPEKNLVNELTSRQITPAFTAAEIALLDLLVKKGEKNEAASVDEVNKLLGLAHKNDDVQKKNRSEFILLINQKWALTHGNEHPLIERQRSDSDRRSFEYYLAAQWRDELNNWMS